MDGLRVCLGGAELCSRLAGVPPVLPHVREAEMTLRVCTEVASAQPIAGTYLFKRGLGPPSPGHCCPFSPQRTSLAAPLTTISVAGRRQLGPQCGAGTRA